MVEVWEKIDDVVGSQSTAEEEVGYVAETCLLKVQRFILVSIISSAIFFYQGIPDCVCLLDVNRNTIVVFCAEVSPIIKCYKIS